MSANWINSRTDPPCWKGNIDFNVISLHVEEFYTLFSNRMEKKNNDTVPDIIWKNLWTDKENSEGQYLLS